MNSNKYKKYKNKYLNLKNQIGGGIYVQYDKEMFNEIIDLGQTQCGANVLNMLGFSAVFIKHILHISKKYNQVDINSLLTVIKKYNKVIRNWDPDRILYDPGTDRNVETSYTCYNYTKSDSEKIYTDIFFSLLNGFATFYYYKRGDDSGHFSVILKSNDGIPYIYEPQTCQIIKGKRNILKEIIQQNIVHTCIFTNSLRVKKPKSYFVEKESADNVWVPEILPIILNEQYKYISPFADNYLETTLLDLTSIPCNQIPAPTPTLPPSGLPAPLPLSALPAPTLPAPAAPTLPAPLPVYYTDINRILFEFKFNRTSDANTDIINLLKRSKAISTEPPSKMILIKNNLEDILSNFITTNWFSTQKTSEKIFLLTNDIFTYSIKCYCSINKINPNRIKFVSKGGIVLYMIKNKILTKLDSTIQKVLNDYFNDYFKKSDMDFSIVIDDTFSDDEYEIIYKDMNDLSYWILIVIRAIIIENPEYCDFLTKSTYEKNNKLNELLQQINSVDIEYEGSNINNFNFQGIIHQNLKHITHFNRMDGLIEEKTQDKFVFLLNDETKLYTLFNKFSNYIITWNNSIDTTQTDEIIKTKFHLNRMKSIFNLFYINETTNKIDVLNLKGEIIDVSIQHKNTTHLMKLENIEENKIGPNGMFNTGTLDYQIKDLRFMIFKFTKYPWEGGKYEKRLYRLFLILFFKELTLDDMNYDSNIKTLKLLSIFIRRILSIKIKDLKKFKQIKTLPQIKGDTSYNVIVDEINNMNSNLIKETDEYILANLKNYEDFLTIITKNIEILQEIFELFQKLRTPSPIIQKQLSELSINKKYYKYKKKYVQLKNELDELY